MPFYPETTVVHGLVRVLRDRALPTEAVPRTVHSTIVGGVVEAFSVILEGDILREYRILDVAKELKVRKPDPDQIDEFITVAENERVESGQELARRGRGRRAKRVTAPADGLVVRIEGQFIIFQVSERAIEVQAKIPGEIEKAESHLVRVAGNGALLQCAWGNGQFAYDAYKFLPEGGFVELTKMDVQISEYRGMVLISPFPVSQGDLLVAQQQEVHGVVAPSMPSNLREFALKLSFPVLLTEGFGQRRPTALIYRLLQDNMGRQAAFNAAIPDRWSDDHPEIMIPLPSGGSLPPTPTLDQALTVGAHVRIMRAPWDGMIGEVVELPDAPQVVGNGLRVPSAKVRLPNERIGVVPLANLESLG
jgi:hypothetical protein